MWRRQVLLLTILSLIISNLLKSQEFKVLKYGKYSFEVPKEYLDERDDIPGFWVNTNDDVNKYLLEKVKKGKVEIIGVSAGGRPIYAVSYGKPRQWNGTTTFSGSLGFRNVEAYRGPDHDKKVYLGLSGVHGGEFEGIVGTINLISIIETGKDLRGNEWPEITKVVDLIDRLVLIPIVNPDGRARVPIRMQKYRDGNHLVHEYLNTGGNPDGTLIGWPQVKALIPLDFNRPGFPGGYPNDAGVNIMHDDFFGNVQPETRALLNITAKEKPDVSINMHTGADYMFLLRPFAEMELQPVFDSIYKHVHSRLASEGLLKTRNIEKESNSAKVKMGKFNLDGALNLHSGTLSIVVESPSHGYARKSGGKLAEHTPEMLLDAQLYCHFEVLNFLAISGGRSKWH